MGQHLLPPFRTIDGVRNFREFGGYLGHDGRQIARGHLFRSANYAKITDEGLKQFADTGIKTIIDLRRGIERQKNPNRLSGLDVETIFSSRGDGDGVSLPPHMQFIQKGDLSIEACEAHMISAYQRLPWEPQHQETYRRTFESLAQGKGPIVVHCAAGKDRTGVLCALVLHVLGVSPQDILHDYLLTNAVPLDRAWLEDYASRLSGQIGRTLDPMSVIPMQGVHRDYLDAAYAEMTARHGGLDRYLVDIGVDGDLQAQVRARLLV